MTLIKKCAKCGLVDPKQHKCKLTGRKIEDTDFCSNFNDNPIKCQICHKITLSPILETYNDITHILCHNCSDALSTCAGCTHGDDKDCDFKQNPSPLPMVVVKQVRQGNMITQAQVLNPERQAITCALGCKCWDSADKVCNKDTGICANYTFNDRVFSEDSRE